MKPCADCAALRVENKRLKHLILTNKEYEKLDTLRRVYADRDEQKRKRRTAEALNKKLAEDSVEYIHSRDAAEARVVELEAELDALRANSTS